MPDIHPTAIVGSDCSIAEGASIGPGCVLDGPVTLESGVRLLPGVNIYGPATIGAGTIIYPFAVLGTPPQDYKFAPGSPTAGIRVGPNCILREHTTIHAASNTETPTTLGTEVFMMVGSHVGHDSTIGNRVILTNGSLVAGHVRIDDGAILSGNAAVHQFVHIGRLAMIGGVVALVGDVPPFCMVTTRNRIEGLNIVGMRRSGMERQHITRVRQAVGETLLKPLPNAEIIARLDALSEGCPPVQELADFVRNHKRPLAKSLGAPPHGFDQWLEQTLHGSAEGTSSDRLSDASAE